MVTGPPHVRRPSLALAAAIVLILHGIAAAAPHHHAVAAFSSDHPPSAAAAGAFDRFRAECPAPPASVALFDPSLVRVDNGHGSGSAGETFVAVYRSANNLPSVIMRDELFASMRIATTVSDPTGGIETSESSGSSGTSSSSGAGAAPASSGVEAPVPLAVGRLRPSPEFEGSYVIDDLRCSLKKEDTDQDCDGGSEHTEALGVCIDELLMHRLRLAATSGGIDNKKGKDAASFDGALRCKATLVSGPLLSDRGFQEIEDFPLPSDMATHISSLDGCMERYASRVVDTSKTNIGARERALKVLSLLGQLNREDEKKAKKEGDGDGDDGFDPWASVNLPDQWGR